jgi:uncharacterized protein (DUF58 family)
VNRSAASRRGRPPSLTSRGRAFAASGAVLMIGGALLSSWQVTALGVSTLAALCVLYILFYPTSILVWRHHLELAWSLERPAGEDGFVVGRPFRIRVSLRNRGPLSLGHASLRLFASSALESPGAFAASLGARSEVTVSGELTALCVGTWHLHGAAVELKGALGLCAVEAYFPSSLAIQVFPRPSVRALPEGARPQSGAPDDKLGLHALRLRGSGGELRELREHAPGDPFKHIAWKATARTGRLMVRDLDRETMTTHFLLVDLGATMRRGRAGATKLDFAIDLASAYARAALKAGDRAGLITFDGRIVDEVKPGDGPSHRLRLVQPLLSAMNAVDEDLTELTDSELVAQVARYLLHQEGVDTRQRRAPPIDDPSWAHLAASATGELYDLRVLEQAVQSALGPTSTARLSTVRAQTPEMQRLRLFCRLRGIELPYRRVAEEGRRSSGLGAALERAARGRGSQRIVVLSDLEGLERGLDEVARAVRLARRRGHRLVCAAPSAKRFAPGHPAARPKGLLAADQARLAEIALWDAERRERAAQHRIAALGVRVLSVGPGDSESALIAQLAPGAQGGSAASGRRQAGAGR